MDTPPSPASGRTEPRPSGAPPVLAGLRIVEFSAFVAVPSACLALAQLGADVIRVDPPGGNIDARRWPVNAEGRSLYWGSLNRGKRSIEIDVRSDRGVRLVQDLLAAPGDGGGIFVTNLGVDGGLAWEALSKRRPDLIMVQLSGSPDGTNAIDYTVNCAVGFPLVTGDGRGGPVNHVLPAWDLIAGMTLATAILAAERHRRLTGEGQQVRLTLADVALAATSNLAYIADAQVNGSGRRADGNFLYGAYGDSFATADGRHVMIAAISDRQWRALVRAIGVEAGLQTAAAALGHRLDTEAGRYDARELISACLRPWFARRTLGQVAEALADRSILWGPYRSFQQMLAEDPRCSSANPMFDTVDHAGYGRFLTAASPIDFGAAARIPPAVAPTLGAHTRSVLSDVLGLDAVELDALQADRVIGGGPG
jgi:2-methylfumaryl-CoA isomerase